MNLRYTKNLLWAKKITIVPKPKQSVRSGKFAMYTDPKKKDYQEAVKAAIATCQDLPEFPYNGPLALEVIFCFKITGADQKPKAKKIELEERGWKFDGRKNNDLDNLCKPVADALNDIIVEDDGLFAATNLLKIKSQRPFVSIKVYRLKYEGEL